MRKKKEKKPVDYFVADFETTVYTEEMLKEKGLEEQDETEVWAAAITPVPKTKEELDKMDKSGVDVYNNIYEFLEHLQRLPNFSVVLFHNLAFDGSFLLSALHKLGYLPATVLNQDGDEEAYAPSFMMPDYTFTICVNDMGQFYNIRIKFEDKVIEIRDSLKLVPMSVKQMGDAKKGFDTKFKKEEMEYEGDRHAFGYITAEEESYIKNDVLVVAEVMYRMIYEYHFTEMTIASNALKFYKEIITEPVFNMWFPDLTEIELPNGMTCYEFCRKGYSGGWCTRNPHVGNKTYLADDNFSYLVNDYVKVKNICEIDVNSLYPSKMSDPNVYYPIGTPEYKTGEPTKKDKQGHVIFRRFKCRFKIKPGHLPFIHIKGLPKFYNSHECLTTTDVDGKRFAEYYEYEYEGDTRKKVKKEFDTTHEFVMCETEYKLFREHYKVFGYEALDYLVFDCIDGETMFGEYVKKFAEMKIKAAQEKNPSKKQIAKLCLNSLYGRMATNTCSSWKEIYFDEDIIRFRVHPEFKKKTVSISVGACITAEARNFTITAAQQNYFEGEDRGWVYSDTDSCFFVDMYPDEVKGITYDKAKFNCWDFEISRGVAARMCKQKTYCVVATEESFEPVLDKQGNPSYNIVVKAAGLNSAAKDVLKECFELEEGETKTIEFNGNKQYEICKLYLNDFKPGFELIGANLKSRQCKGGIVLGRSDFKLS